MLAGAMEAKIRPAVVIASEVYLRERPGVLVGILTTKIPALVSASDYVLEDWNAASLRARSCFRAYVLTLDQSDASVIGQLSRRDWEQVRLRVRAAFAQV